MNPRTLDEVDYLVSRGRERGYRHFDVKMAPDVEFDVALCRRVRALAPRPRRRPARRSRGPGLGVTVDEAAVRRAAAGEALRAESDE